MLPQQYCLRWRYHHSNLQTMFSQLLEREAFCDVTLACEGKTIKAHKIVLSACSTYFETILSQYEEKDPILIMKDVKYVDIKCLVEFMYKGEINVDHCHLATLLKTAEELKIKGLAEVSWRDEDQAPSQQQQNAETNNINGVQSSTSLSTSSTSAALPQVSTVMDQNSKMETPPNRKKRGRPPIDDYEQAYTAPKIMNVQGNVLDENYSNDGMSNSDHDLSIWEEDPSANEAGDMTEPDEPMIRVKKEELNDDDGLMEDLGDQFSPSDSKYDGNSSRAGSTKSVTNVTTSGGQSFLTPALEKEWPDVIKMNDYLNTGRRQQFWEEPFTKRVMDAIKTKNLEMKVAAELLGVSYGTLYGRYRDSYGCLKHPYRPSSVTEGTSNDSIQMANLPEIGNNDTATFSLDSDFQARIVRDFWTEQGPTDVLLKLKKKEITLYRAAEQLNVTPQTLTNYLISMSQIDNNSTTSAGGGGGNGGHSNNLADLNNQSNNNSSQVIECYDDDEEEEEEESDEDDDVVLPDLKLPTTNNSSLFKSLLTKSSSTSSSNSVLANCPDITIIKKDKSHDSSKVNNNSEHSNSNSDQK